MYDLTVNRTKNVGVCRHCGAYIERTDITAQWRTLPDMSGICDKAYYHQAK